MAGFIYFVPGLTREATDAELGERGLAYALLGDGDKRIGNGVRNGPGGLDGVTFGLKSAVQPQHLGYHPDRQTWRKAPGGKFWVGYDPSQPPTPEAMGQRKALEGRMVELGDGQSYRIPVARSFAENDGETALICMLPHRSGIDDDGNWIADGIESRYQRLWDVAVQWWDAKVALIPQGESAAMLEFAGLHDAALDVLSVNYRLGKVEAVMLGLLTERVAVEILDAASDIATAMAWAKKKD